MLLRLLKKGLIDWTKLHIPLPNFPFIVYMDASSTGLGAVLAQENKQGKRSIHYLSRKLSAMEWKYAVIEKEALAIRWAVDQLQYCLWGCQFTVVILDEGY